MIINTNKTKTKKEINIRISYWISTYFSLHSQLIIEEQYNIYTLFFNDVVSVIKKKRKEKAHNLSVYNTQKDHMNLKDPAAQVCIWWIKL